MPSNPIKDRSCRVGWREGIRRTWVARHGVVRRSGDLGRSEVPSLKLNERQVNP
jgi:hypothetical protein